jgi:CRISPR-associated protein Csh1
MLDSREIKEDEYYDGICSLCGSIGKVTANTKELKFKYYNTDKSSFASNMNGSYFKKNLSLCSNCYNNLGVSNINTFL